MFERCIETMRFIFEVHIAHFLYGICICICEKKDPPNLVYDFLSRKFDFCRFFQQTLNPQAKKNDLSYYNASDASISNQCIAAASEYCESAKSTTVGDFIAFKSKVLFKNFWLTWRCNLFLVRSHSHLIVRKNQIWEVKTVYYLDSNIEY